MISESVIIFGGTGNVVMVINGPVPKDAPVMFKVGSDCIELLSDNNVIYIEKGLSAYVCQRLKKKNEIGILEMMKKGEVPKHLTNVAYQMAQ